MHNLPFISFFFFFQLELPGLDTIRLSFTLLNSFLISRSLLMEKPNAKKISCCLLRIPPVALHTLTLVPLFTELLPLTWVGWFPGVKLCTFRCICKISAVDELLLCHFHVLLMTLYSSYELGFLEFLTSLQMQFGLSKSKAPSSRALTRVSCSQRRQRSLSKEQTILGFGAKAPSGNAMWLSLGR